MSRISTYWSKFVIIGCSALILGCSSEEKTSTPTPPAEEITEVAEEAPKSTIDFVMPSPLHCRLFINLYLSWHFRQRYAKILISWSSFVLGILIYQD